jgi:hypothetical protein
VASKPETKGEYKQWLIRQITDRDNLYLSNLAAVAEAAPRIRAKAVAEAAPGIIAEVAPGIIADRDMEYAKMEFRSLKPGDDISAVMEKLSRLRVSKDVIESARKSVEDERRNKKEPCQK